MTEHSTIPGPPVIRCDGLVKRYEAPSGAVEALRGLDLEIQAGESVAITGPSGCGKTSLLNILGSLDRPTAGHVEVAGVTLGALGPRGRAEFRRRSIGFVFQQFHLVPTLTAEENVALPLSYAGVARAERRRRAADWLQRVGLDARREHFPAMLSGGEQQRVAVARALVTGARLLLADEPTGNLDGETAAQILELLTASLDDGGEDPLTLVIVTHDPELAASLGRTVRLRDGQVDDTTTDRDPALP